MTVVVQQQLQQFQHGFFPSNTATAYTPQYTTNVTGQSEIENLENAVQSGTKAGTQDIRVYVVEDDIRQAGNKVDVRETEATF